MNAMLFDVGHIECDVPLPEPTVGALTSTQKRVLELQYGDSFVLRAVRSRNTMTSRDGSFPKRGAYCCPSGALGAWPIG